VKLCDVNLLLYAYDASSARHVRAKDWLEGQLSGVEAFAFSWAVVLAFVRLVTNPRIFEAPLGVADAFGIVESWLAAPCATVVHPGSRHVLLLRQLLEPLGTGGNLTTDAHLAALALEHDAELCSADPDFSRFPGVRWSNPLAPTGAR
jgi:toxin-antitoxin system PIN domain toxin